MNETNEPTNKPLLSFSVAGLSVSMWENTADKADGGERTYRSVTIRKSFFSRKENQLTTQTLVADAGRGELPRRPAGAHGGGRHSEVWPDRGLLKPSHHHYLRRNDTVGVVEIKGTDDPSGCATFIGAVILLALLALLIGGCISVLIK